MGGRHRVYGYCAIVSPEAGTCTVAAGKEGYSGEFARVKVSESQATASKNLKAACLRFDGKNLR